MWRILCFQRNYAIFVSDSWVCSRPFSPFIHRFFRLNPKARKKSPVRMLDFPVVRNFRKAKSVFSKSKVPSA